jgi:hypothetical protein
MEDFKILLLMFLIFDSRLEDRYHHERYYCYYGLNHFVERDSYWIHFLLIEQYPRNILISICQMSKLKNKPYT